MLDNLRLPPYGKILQAYLHEKIHLKNPIYIYVGDEAKEMAYSEKCNGNMCTYLPENEDFNRYFWPIYKQYVILYHTGGIPVVQLKRFGFYLLTFNPRLIYLFSDEPCGLFFVPEMEISK